MRVYFDNAATTPLEPRVVDEMIEVMKNVYGNPSSLHQEGRKARTLIERARKTVSNLLDVEAVGKMCRENHALFHCDMVETIGHLPIKLKEWGVHFTAASAHKFNGPKGIGFLYLDSNIKIKPFIEGGAQERNMRGGT